jgi:hypothetical protein
MGVIVLSESVNSSQSCSLPRRRPGWVLAAVLLWLALIGAGMGLLWAHTLTPGQKAEAPGDWPAGSGLRPSADRATLLMWCHPHCPCTRASLEQLGELARRTAGRVSIRVCFVRPPGTSAEWADGGLWRQAKNIPEVTVSLDDGREVRCFGARTSGQVLLFSRDRRLLFSGGITAGRGHLGESAGLAAALRQIESGSGKLETAPVFGCSLLGTEPVGSRSQASGSEGTR